jgi:hypothetical protein
LANGSARVAGHRRGNGTEGEISVEDFLQPIATTMRSHFLTERAVEGLRRQWSIEHGEHGIRFVTLKTGGIPETIPEGMPGREEILASVRDAALLDRLTASDAGQREAERPPMTSRAMSSRAGWSS